MQDFFGDDPRFTGAGAGEDELDAAGCYSALLGGGEGHGCPGGWCLRRIRVVGGYGESEFSTDKRRGMAIPRIGILHENRSFLFLL